MPFLHKKKRDGCNMYKNNDRENSIHMRIFRIPTKEIHSCNISVMRAYQKVDLWS